jgi:uncharacterized phage-associated protein
MSASTQPLQPLVSSVLAVLKAAREEGHEITRTKLVKLLYLADLKAVEEGDPPFTGATWRWRHFGPHDQALVGAENAAVDMDLVDRDDQTRPFEYGFCVLRLAIDIDDPLPRETMSVVRRVVREFGARSAGALKELSYKTPPMVEAATADDRHGLLDLSQARRAKQMDALITRHRAARRLQPVQTRDDGAADALVRELTSMRDLRRRANTEVLGDQ